MPVVTTRRFDGIAVIEMNRPERRNAMDSAMLEELLERLRDAREDETVTAVVLTGAGGVFSSGADVAEQVDDTAAARRMELFCDLYETVTGFPKPTVAAVSGPCIGGGAEVAAGCDLRVGTSSVALRFPGAQFGIPIGAARLPLLVGMSHAKDLLMTARTAGAQDAFRIGFLNRIVDEAELEHEAVALAAAMAARPGAAMQKGLLDETSDLTERVRAENQRLVRWRSPG